MNTCEDQAMQPRFHAASTADEVLSRTDLAGQRFLITGVTSGIGLETARALAARGASIVGTSLHPDQATATVENTGMR